MASTSITDVEAVVNNYAADQVSAIQTADAATLAQLKVTDAASLAAVTAQLQVVQAAYDEYKKDHPPVVPPVGSSSILWGASTGGMQVNGVAEAADVAFKRINAALGGIDVVRWWRSALFTAAQIPTWIGRLNFAVEIDLPIAEVIAGTHDADFTNLVKICGGLGRVVAITPWHEGNQHVIDGDYTQPQLKSGLNHLMALFAKANASDNVFFVPVLTGGEFITNAPGPEKDRRVNAGLHYTDYLPDNMSSVKNVLLGADPYQHGKTNETVDSAATILQPVIDAAKALGLRIALMELGVRALPAISDAVSAKSLTDMIAIIDANAALFVMVLYFESWQGKLGPWCITNGDRPLTCGVYRAVCQRH